MTNGETEPKLEALKNFRQACRPEWEFQISSAIRHSSFVIILSLFTFIVQSHADQIAEIGVSPHAIYTGNTYHGYAEILVTLENDSPKQHVVTLVYPNNGYGNYGNCIGRLLLRTFHARTPGATEVVLAPGTGPCPCGAMV